jgi:PelA/Pel-15E family pectate lyase
MLLLGTLTGGWSAGLIGAEPAGKDFRSAAVDALKRAARFYRENAARHGGYVYYYSLDRQQRWGEGAASADTIFVQPPGTPTVGMAYLAAWAATKDPFYRDAARETAAALVYGQLESGGWTQTIHFAPHRRAGKYRNGKGGNWNASSLDDGQTQAALMMLIRTDQALEFKDAAISNAARYGLDALLKAQFPNGAFPQVWTGPVAPQPVVPAQFPDYDWKTEGRVKNYWDFYTLNDNLAGTVAATLITAHEVYRDARYRAALEKLGSFLKLAQMPEPQPGWCQQYNYAMVPIWARKFEPPAVTGSESQDALETLIRIAQYTGQREFLEPVPRGLAWLKRSRLADGSMARFYELQTNRPLYMDERYRLTYDGAAAPSHYGWKQPARLAEIERSYQDALAARMPDGPAAVTAADVRNILRDLDPQGRWVSTYAGERLVGQPKFSPGFRYLSSALFSRNVETLSRFIASRGQ